VAFNDRGLAMKGRRVLLLGLSYKRNTGDARESPARAVVAELLELGAEVRGVDPHVLDEQLPPGVVRCDLTADELAAADAVVLLVDHDDFDLDLVGRTAGYVLDCRNRVAGPNVERL
jgi:UDP-N-acetyl-D-glucosamine dehydrogenase